MRSKGAIERVTLAPNVELDVKHLGMHQAGKWGLQLQACADTDRPRVLALKKEFKKSDWPELYDEDYRTLEGHNEASEALEAILVQAVAGLTIDGQVVPPEEAVEELLRLGLHGAAFSHIMTIQNPSQASVFTEGSGDVDA